MDFTVDRPIEDIIPLTTTIPPFHQLRHMWNPGFEESEELMQLDHVSNKLQCKSTGWHVLKICAKGHAAVTETWDNENHPTY